MEVCGPRHDEVSHGHEPHDDDESHDGNDAATSARVWESETDNAQMTQMWLNFLESANLCKILKQTSTNTCQGTALACKPLTIQHPNISGAMAVHAAVHMAKSNLSTSPVQDESYGHHLHSFRGSLYRVMETARCETCSHSTDMYWPCHIQSSKKRIRTKHGPANNHSAMRRATASRKEETTGSISPLPVIVSQVDCRQILRKNWRRASQLQTAGFFSTSCFWDLLSLKSHLKCLEEDAWPGIIRKQYLDYSHTHTHAYVYVHIYIYIYI